MEGFDHLNFEIKMIIRQKFLNIETKNYSEKREVIWKYACEEFFKYTDKEKTYKKVAECSYEKYVGNNYDKVLDHFTTQYKILLRRYMKDKKKKSVI